MLPSKIGQIQPAPDHCPGLEKSCFQKKILVFVQPGPGFKVFQGLKKFADLRGGWDCPQGGSVQMGILWRGFLYFPFLAKRVKFSTQNLPQKRVPRARAPHPQSSPLRRWTPWVLKDPPLGPAGPKANLPTSGVGRHPTLEGNPFSFVKKKNPSPFSPST